MFESEDLLRPDTAAPELVALAQRLATDTLARLRQTPPPGVSAADIDSFQLRRGAFFAQELLGSLLPFADQILARLQAAQGPRPAVRVPVDVVGRTEANLAAMEIVARHGPPYSPAEMDALARYSGWGGLSIKKVAHRFPAGFPVPDKAALVHEYYTRADVGRAVGQAIASWPEALPGSEGRFKALEPSAGVGRFLAGLAEAGLSCDWKAVEYSQVSGRILKARFPDANVSIGPFERWVRTSAEFFDLVVSNPPYGPRGMSLAEDDQGQRIRAAYHYFIWRTLGLLKPGGLGVYLVPGGLMTGTGRRITKLRDELLRTAHLSCAFRLPSEDPKGTDDPLFPGANLVIDLLFFRKRPATLSQVLAEDAEIASGDYFERHPHHILGEVEGADTGEDGSGVSRPAGRWGYSIVGPFTGLPPIAGALRPMPDAGHGVEIAAPKARPGRGSVVADLDTEIQTEDIDLQVLDALGRRVRAYLGELNREDTDQDLASMRAELVTDIAEWVARSGPPASYPGVQQAARSAPGIAQALAALAHDGSPGPALRVPPEQTRRYQGPPEIGAIAAWLLRQESVCTLPRLAEMMRAESGRSLSPAELEADLEAAGWCEDIDGWWPREEYLAGLLWPKVDRLDQLSDPDRAERQRALLLEAIAPVSWADLVDPCVVRDDENDVLGDGGLTPRDPYVPVHQVMRWQEQSDLFEYERPLLIERNRGLLELPNRAYHQLPTSDKDRKSTGFRKHHPHLQFIGWANHDNRLWAPPRRTLIVDGEEQKESLDAARVRVAGAWIRDFRTWVKRDTEAQQAIEDAYNRQVRGVRPLPVHPEPQPVARWKHPKIRLHAYQHGAANRILRRRRGLLAFDVGLGKTYTGIHVLARARQEGWARRPVIIVPNSIVWKWHRDILRVLPDYRVCVIGSERRLLTRGARKGRFIAEVDSPQERAAKWTAFAAGAYDVVLLTQSMIGRQRIEADTLTDFAETVAGIRRLAALARTAEDGRGDEDDDRDSKRRKKTNSTERQDAVAEEASAGWLMSMLQGNIGQDYDPGITWEQVGCDLLLVDESQTPCSLPYQSGAEVQSVSPPVRRLPAHPPPRVRWRSPAARRGWRRSSPHSAGCCPSPAAPPPRRWPAGSRSPRPRCGSAGPPAWSPGSSAGGGSGRPPRWPCAPCSPAARARPARP